MVYTNSQLQVGDSNECEKTITAADVLLFSAVSGDCNPMHINDEFAGKSKFKRRIAHGALTSSLISTALTNAFPTSIYISQYSEFKSPVYLGDTIKAVVTCIDRVDRRTVYCNSTDPLLHLQCNILIVHSTYSSLASLVIASPSRTSSPLWL